MNIIELIIEDFDPVEFYLGLHREQSVSFLHTGLMTDRDHWSVLAWAPQRTIVRWEDLPRDCSRHPCKLPFCGGVIGVLPYDSGGGLLPPVIAYEYDQFLCYDLKTGKVYTSAPEFVMEMWQRPKLRHSEQTSIRLQPLWTHLDYAKRFNRIKEFILDGDIYQVNLSYPWTARFTSDARGLFARLCKQHPSSMSAYIQGDDFELVSCSPERFLALDGNVVQTMPIKGTRPRGATPVEDQRMHDELLSSAKETAELAMITDLLRNDIGQVCQIGSVEVKQFKAIQQWPTVWHTHSLIEGVLADRYHAIDLLRACFPGGSVTGCPKRRAMEIIQEVEQSPRGLYTGSVINLSQCGKMDSNIVIRSLVASKNALTLNVGGGIVVDSDCNAEYQETLDKAKAFLSL
ncbi:chorismate-binding protein [Candidatus Uhrbacteria bacterium]|nr:chorismate-binding protein [Candidatus Uhrbacteria bacterium]